MNVRLAVNLLASLVGLVWCQEPERPAYNFGLRYRVYGDTKTCTVSPDGTRSCRWYQTQYFQDLPKRLRIDTNIKNFFESSFYFPGDGGFVRYRYVPSNWRTPCTRELVPIMPIQRVPISFNFNGTDTVEGRVCNVWRRDTGYNPVTTERWCIHDNNYVTPPTTEPLSFTVKRTNLTKETLWRGYTTYVDKSYFDLPYACPTLAPTVESANGDGSGNGDNNNDGGLTTEATKTTMTTKIQATTNGTKPETTTLAAETAAMQGGVGNSSENNNRGNDSTMAPKTTMTTKLETTTTAIQTNNGNDDENNNSSTSTMPPKTTISTKTETEAMEAMTTMETKGDDGVENENDNNDNGSAMDPITTMATKMETAAMGEMTKVTTKANDGVEYEKDDEGSTSTMPPKTIMSTEMEIATMTTTVANDGEEEEDNNNGDNGDGDDLFNTA